MRRNLRPLLALLLLLSVPALHGCTTGGAEADSEVRAELQRQLEGRRSWLTLFRRNRVKAAVDERDVAPLVTEFYRQRKFRPVWVNGGGMTDRAKDAVSLLKEATAVGLGPMDRDAAQLGSLVDSLDTGLFEKRPPVSSLARLELLVTRELMQHARHRSGGRVDPKLLPADWHVTPRKVDVVAAVAEAVGGDLGGRMAQLDPQHPEFERLRDARARYAAIVAEGGWQKIPAGPALKPGSRGARVSLLRARLAASGELREGAEGDAFDPALEQAVRRFQTAIGLDVTGRVGATELASLNVPAEKRLEQIELNLERWRWVPDAFGARAVIVNIPAYSLEVRDGGKPVMAMRVVVGKQWTPTPMLTDRIEHVVINPYWNVPQSIASQELLAELQADPSALSRQNMKLFENAGENAVEVDPASVNWSQVSAEDFRYRIRQEPGDGNALGRIKFVLTNPYDIYLHDTPSDHLFERNQRNFSHGCVRVEKPLELASFLLRDQSQWDASSIESQIAAGEEKWVKLTEPMPAHLVYWTAWVDSDGVVSFRDDVYELDRQLLDVLRGRNPAAPVAASGHGAG